MENNYCFMAFAQGKESVDNSEVKRYVGVAPVYVLGVNPNKETLETLYGTTLEKEPEYLSTNTNADGREIPVIRIDFIVKTDAEKYGIEMVTKIPFFVRKEYRLNRDKSKVQIIDKYGRTAWATKEELKNRTIPIYASGPANIDKDYRPAYVGEEALTNFLIAYLNIPSVMRLVDNVWIMNKNTSDSEARLDNIEDYFKGDVSELRNALALQPNNKVKALFGVKTSEDNKQYQAVYTEMFLKNSVYNYSRLDKDLQDRKNAGAYPSTEFEVCDLKEYNVAATDFTKEETVDSPFDQATPWD